MGRWIKKVDPPPPPHNHDYPTNLNMGLGSVWECSCGDWFILRPFGKWVQFDGDFGDRKVNE